MHTATKNEPSSTTSETIFSAIRDLVDERLQKHLDTVPSLDDTQVLDEIADFACRFGAIDQATALTALIRFARMRELRDLANQIAILAFERFGQELHILDEKVGGPSL
jgi:hypothetical protein